MSSSHSSPVSVLCSPKDGPCDATHRHRRDDKVQCRSRIASVPDRAFLEPLGSPQEHVKFLGKFFEKCVEASVEAWMEGFEMQRPCFKPHRFRVAATS